MLRFTAILFCLALPSLLVACGGAKTSLVASGFNHSGDWTTDEFAVDSETRDKLDILLIIDKSESMQTSRSTLAGKLNALLDSIDHRDWKIAIATTDTRDCLRALITPQDNNPNKFADAIEGIGGGSNKEEAIKVAIRALRNGLPLRNGSSCDGELESWRRPAKETALALIIVTDEDHQCDKDNSNDQCTLQELHDLLELMGYIPRITAKLYGFLHLQKAAKFTAWKDKAGESIFASIKSYDSSADEYEKVLKEISVGLEGIYQSRFTLKKKHDGIKSEVRLILDDDTVQTLTEDQYGFTGKDLVIISALPKNTTSVEVSYSYASN